MNTFSELLQELQSTNIKQNCGDWSDNIPNDIWVKYFESNGYIVVKTGLEVDKHRWYETSVTVVKVLYGFLGIKHISGLFSEGSDYSDCDFTMQFFEMEEYTIISYRKK